jgi:hypothetical protein
MQDMSPTLQEAYDFINRGDLQSARELLQPQIDNNTSNPDVWWLYAHATDDPQAGREALMKVVSLNPTYPGATGLIKQHDEKTGDSASPRTKETSKSEKSPKKRRRLLPIAFHHYYPLGVSCISIRFVQQPIHTFTNAHRCCSEHNRWCISQYDC